jgi:5-methylcytosine-specific restriction protein A
MKARQRESKLSRDKTYDKRRRSSAGRGYNKRWVRIRRIKLQRDPLCERCQEEGLVTEATEVHHIIPISDGGDPYSMKNLMSLCHRCHMRIHAGEGEVKSL